MQAVTTSTIVVIAAVADLKRTTKLLPWSQKWSQKRTTVAAARGRLHLAVTL